MCKYCEKIADKTEYYDDNEVIKFQQINYMPHTSSFPDKEDAYIYRDYLASDMSVTHSLVLWSDFEKYNMEVTEIQYCPWCGNKLK